MPAWATKEWVDAWIRKNAGSSGVTDGDKGDITVSGSGATWTIDNGVVTLAKQANMATGSVVYRKTAGSGAPEVQTLATLKTDLGLTGINSGDQTITLTGEATGSGTSSFAVTLTNASVIGKVLTGFAAGAGTVAATDTILQAFQKIVGNISALVTGVSSVFGRTGAVTAQSGDYTTAQVTESGNLYFTDERAQDAVGAMVDSSLTYVDATPLLQRAALTGDVTASAGSNATTIANSAVTNAKMANMAASTIKGNNTGGAAAPSDLTANQVKTLLAIANTDVSGLGTMSTQNASAVAITGGSATLSNTGLALRDTDASHTLSIVPGSNLTANRTLTLTTGDASRTITLNGDTTLNGTNTGDQTITLTGDVTGSGTGSFAATIANDAVTYAKIQNVTDARLLGRSAGSSGDCQEITVGSGLSLSGGSLTATGGSGGNLIYLGTSGAISAASSVDFTTAAWFASTYYKLIFVLANVTVVTDSVNLWIRGSTDGGSTFLSTSIYDYVNNGRNTADTAKTGSAASAAQIIINGTDTIGNAANEDYTGVVELINPSATLHKTLTWRATYQNTSTVMQMTQGGGRIKTTSAINGIRFVASSGNLASGRINVYGVTLS